MSESLRDALFALSLASLAHVRLWSKLLLSRDFRYYVQKRYPPPRQIAAMIGGILVLCAVLWVLLQLSHQHSHNLYVAVVNIEIILALTVSAIGVSTRFSARAKGIYSLLRRTLGKTGIIVLSGGVAMAALILMFLHPSSTSTLIRALLVWMSPAFVILVLFSLVRVVLPRGNSEFVNIPFAPYFFECAQRKNRLVWILFDELDYRLAFLKRPPSVSLPALDRLVHQSVSCSHAYPPCRCTEISIPALLGGSMIDEAVIKSPVELDLYITGRTHPVSWRDQYTFLGEARQAGFNVAVLNWYHPISRLFGDTIVDNRWFEPVTQENSVGDSFAEMFLSQLRSLLETPSYSLFGQSLPVKRAISNYHKSIDYAISLVTNLRIDVALLHFTIPHGPYIYDRHRSDFSLRNSSPDGYLGNLALSDIALSRLEVAMRDADLWDQSAIILSSDHWWRYSAGFDGQTDYRVPFIVKASHQREQQSFDSPFNTVVTKQLSLAILTDQVRSGPDVHKWLTDNAFYAEPTKK